MPEPRILGRAWHLPLLALLIALVLAACATADPPDDDDDDGDPAPGALVVVVNGLPSGAQGDVVVTGPSFAETIGATETFVGLTPGVYAVNATDVSFEGVDADVNVTGPDGFDESLAASATFSGVEPGVYTATAQDVTAGADVYAATVTGSPATVPAGGSSTMGVAYTFLDPTTVGTLDVDISGLPAGVDAAVNVSGTGVDEELVASASLANLPPGNYTVTGADVIVGDLTYAAIITSSPALVLPEETTTVEVLYQPFVANDLDAASNPGVFARFRATSPGPVSVDEMLFNAASPIDTKGIELRNELANPADTGDWLAFELVHGQGNTTSIDISLECGTGLPVGSIIRAELRDEDGAKLGTTLTCGNTRSYSLPNVGGSGDYLVAIFGSSDQPFYTDYVLAIDAYCFQGCVYQPFEP